VGRVAVLLGLLILVSVVLGGRVPDVQTVPRDHSQDGSASIAGVVTLLAASLLIMAVAVVMSFRRPVLDSRTEHRELPRGVSGARARLSRRLLLLAVVVAVGWLITLMVASLLSVETTELGQDSPTGPTPAQSDGGAAPAAPTQPPQREPDGRVLRYLEVTTVALVLMTLVGTVATAVRRWRVSRPAGPLSPAPGLSRPVPGPEPLAVAAERGLAEVGDLSRGPRVAIIACYAAMEQALASSPGAAPLESDTPSEVLARAIENRAVRAGSATSLVEVFAEARFSRHVMTEDHRVVAERALRSVLDELGQVRP